MYLKIVVKHNSSFFRMKFDQKSIELKALWQNLHNMYEYVFMTLNNLSLHVGIHLKRSADLFDFINVRT